MQNGFDKIYQELKKIPYCDFHFYWEKDEWYPDRNFKHIGKRIRNPLELIFQDYGRTYRGKKIRKKKTGEGIVFYFPDVDTN